MPVNVGARVEGADQLRRTLKAAGDDLADLKSAHKRAADIVSNRARGEAPRRTGALAGSVRGSGTKTAGIVRAGGARVPYAGPIHWGWPSRGIEPQPFLSEAAQATEQAWLPVYEGAIEDAIHKVKGV